jgi:hypothetical protein
MQEHVVVRFTVRMLLLLRSRLRHHHGRCRAVPNPPRSFHSVFGRLLHSASVVKVSPPEEGKRSTSF